VLASDEEQIAAFTASFEKGGENLGRRACSSSSASAPSPPSARRHLPAAVARSPTWSRLKRTRTGRGCPPRHRGGEPIAPRAPAGCPPDVFRRRHPGRAGTHPAHPARRGATSPRSRPAAGREDWTPGASWPSPSCAPTPGAPSGSTSRSSSCSSAPATSRPSTCCRRRAGVRAGGAPAPAAPARHRRQRLPRRHRRVLLARRRRLLGPGPTRRLRAGDEPRDVEDEA
jgi:hypothetical protein